MRYGVLADIHANLDALRAALAALRRERVDGWICAGDLVGYGAYPNECVELVAELGAACVAGNHDMMALGLLSVASCIPLARKTMEWTRSVLGDDSRRYLAALPARVEVEPALVVAHATLEDCETYIVRPSQAVTQLDRLRALYPDAGLLVVGHTHLPAAVGRRAGAVVADGTVPLPENETCLLNPGSVGQSRERDAFVRFGLLDLERPSMTFFGVPYDVESCRRALRQRGLPPNAYHLPPPRFAAASTLRTVARAALGAGRRVTRS